MKFLYAAIIVFDYLFQFYYIRTHKPYFSVRFETEEFRRRNFRKVVGVNIKFACKRNLSLACLVVFRNVREFEIFFFILGVVFYNDFYRMQNNHSSRRRFVQFFSYAMFEKRAVNKRNRLCNACSCDEVENGGWSVSSSSHTANGRHTRVVPAVNRSVLHKFAKQPFRGYGVCDKQFCKLSLLRLFLKAHIVDDPFVKRSVVLKLY